MKRDIWITVVENDVQRVTARFRVVRDEDAEGNETEKLEALQLIGEAAALAGALRQLVRIGEKALGEQKVKGA
jgi:hypothetical protein